MKQLTIRKIKEEVKMHLDQNRYEHTLGVMYTAGALAMRYGACLLYTSAYELEQNEDKIKECLVYLDQHGNNTYMAKIAREKRKSCLLYTSISYSHIGC